MNLHGFKILEKRQIKDSTYTLYEHEKTRARLLDVSNMDENNFFSIGFKTPPLFDTGVTHIIEHSLLNGSKKYRTKEPFMDMIKSSLQTFLNAMTFQDKTLYPIGSKNEEDFHNLMDVYLDAVFNPRAMDDERIFMQEGIRLEAQDDKLKYNGVVYNEMKGATQDPESQIFENIIKVLFKDTAYSYNSGGDPYEILNLTYEDFKSYYKNHYHPTNSYIYLYGNMDKERSLRHIDEYLKNYTYENPHIKLEKIMDLREKSLEIPFNTSDENIEGKNFLSLSVILGDSDDPINRLMGNILSDLLVGEEASPLKRALMEENFGEDYFSYSDSNLQTSLTIFVKNTDRSMGEFKELIIDELIKIVEEGFDKEFLKSTMNMWEYDLREKLNQANRGLIENIQAYDTWLYGGNPIDALDMGGYIEKIREGIDKGFFEEYINERIINGELITILHKATKDLNLEKDKNIRTQLREKRNSMDEDEYISLKEKTEEFKKWQDRENTEDELNTIPSLNLKDLDRTFERIKRKEIQRGKNKYLIHDENTNDLEYIQILFDQNNFKKEELPYLSMVLELIGRLDTKNYRYDDLSKLENMYTGGVYFNQKFQTKYLTNELNRYVILQTRLLSSHEEASKYILELMYGTKFEDKKRIKDVLLMVKSRFEQGLTQEGHILVRNRAKSKINKKESLQEYASGLEYYLTLKDAIGNFSEDLVDKLRDIYNRLFTSTNLLVNITSENGLETIENIAPLIDNLKERTFEYVDIDFKKEEVSEAFITNADVQYISMASDLNDQDLKYEASLGLLSKILSNTYLYQEVRAKEGAYGVGVKIDTDNIISTYSYRDPNLKKTIETYMGMGKYIENMNLSNREFNSFKIGSLGNLKPALSKSQRSSFDLNMYLKEKPYEVLDQNIMEIISGQIEDLKNYSKYIEKSMETKNIICLGSKEKIGEEKDLFDKIINLY